MNISICCSCGVRVTECVMGCTLYPCCGGYVAEGHMGDCARPSEDRAYGAISDLNYHGPTIDEPRRDAARSHIRADRCSRSRGGTTYAGETGNQTAQRDILALTSALLPLFAQMREIADSVLTERVYLFEPLLDGIATITGAVAAIEVARSLERIVPKRNLTQIGSSK
jgi:hypothetical protein